MAFSNDLTFIESRQFAAELSTVSSTEAFFGVLAHHPIVLRVLENLRTSGTQLEEMMGRVLDLCAVISDPRYENPYDVALATYLWLTHFSQQGISQSLAANIDRVPRTWYAKKLAFRIQSQHHLLRSGTWPSPPAPSKPLTAWDQRTTIPLVDLSWRRLVRTGPVESAGASSAAFAVQEN